MSKNKKLSIIIVNWNTSKLISKCLNSVKKNLDPAVFEVFVVDNNSSDDSVKLIKSKYKWVNLIENSENLGFAKANNQVLKTIKSEFVLILNPDTEIIKGSVEKMRLFLEENKKIAAVGPKLLNPNKSIQHLGFYRKSPSILQAIFFYTDLYKLTIKIKPLVKLLWEEDVENNHPMSVDQIPGACIFARTAILKKMGFFDERYPFWFEDVDLCFKLKQSGYQLVYLPSAKIVHVVGGASDKWTDRAKKEARFFKSLFIFFDKNKPRWQSVFIRVIIIASQLFMFFSRLFMQIIRPNKKRGFFLKLKLQILWNLATPQQLPKL